MAKSSKGVLPIYPANHPVGSIVPEGGSSCAKCEYVRGQNCKQKDFVAWNGGPKIPGPINAYCCDFFEVAPKIRDVKFEDVDL